MAVLTLHRDRLRTNYTVLNNLFHTNDAEWSIVTKMLCGHRGFMTEVLATGIPAVCDSRLSNLRMAKRLAPDVGRVYIKPPPKRYIRGVVETAQISFNSEIRTITWLSEAATAVGVNHGVVIMVEGGDLREGVTDTDTLLQLCEETVKLPNVQLVGIGTNFNCLSGVLPTQEAMQRLLEQHKQVEEHIGRELQWVTGGSSAVIPNLLRGEVPRGINHYRIGESLYFGNDIIEGSTLPGMERDVFTLESEIIEIGEKPSAPTGLIQAPPSGDPPVSTKDADEMSVRAIVDVGLLDVGKAEYLEPIDPRISIVGASSDMLVLDITDAQDEYVVGKTLSFHVGYMATLSAMNSKYVEKRVEIAGGDRNENRVPRTAKDPVKGR